MLVKVKRRAFIGGQLRRPGEVFDCHKDSFSSNWGDKVKKGTKSKIEQPTGYIPLEIPDLIEKHEKKTASK